MKMQQNDEEKFENFLRQFRPREPRPLPAMQRKGASRAERLLRIAAGVLFVVGGFLWMYRIGKIPRQNTNQTQIHSATETNVAQSIALGRMTRLMLEDPVKADAELDKVSSQLLLDVTRSHGALRALATE